MWVCGRDEPIPVSVSAISAYRHTFQYRQYRYRQAKNALSIGIDIGVSAKMWYRSIPSLWDIYCATLHCWNFRGKSGFFETPSGVKILVIYYNGPQWGIFVRKKYFTFKRYSTPKLTVAPPCIKILLEISTAAFNGTGLRCAPSTCIAHHGTQDAVIAYDCITSPTDLSACHLVTMEASCGR